MAEVGLADGCIGQQSDTYAGQARQEAINQRPFNPIDSRIKEVLEIFNLLVTSVTVPIATGWNDNYRVGISPTEK